MITNDTKVGIEYREVLAPYAHKRLEFSGSVARKSLSSNKRQYTLLIFGVISPTLKKEAINHLWIKVSKQYWDTISVEDVVRFSGVVSPYKHISNTELAGVKVAYGQVAYGIKGVKIMDFERNNTMTTVKSFKELSEINSKEFEENNPTLEAKKALREYIQELPDTMAELSLFLGRNKNYLNQMTYSKSKYSRELIEKTHNDLKKKIARRDKKVASISSSVVKSEISTSVKREEMPLQKKASASDWFVTPKIITVESLEQIINKFVNDDQFDAQNIAMKQRVYGMNFLLKVAEGSIEF